MDTALLILNAGPSSLKFAVYRADMVGTLHPSMAFPTALVATANL
jgi:acetate kinase